MCIRAYLDGDGMGEKAHLSLFFVIMKGEFDALLPWPFQSRNTLTLINQDNRSGDVCEVFRANPQSKSFQRPTTEMNVASGYPYKVHSIGVPKQPKLCQTRCSVHSYIRYMPKTMYAFLQKSLLPIADYPCYLSAQVRGKVCGHNFHG